MGIHTLCTYVFKICQKQSHDYKIKQGISIDRNTYSYMLKKPHALDCKIYLLNTLPLEMLNIHNINIMYVAKHLL